MWEMLADELALEKGYLIKDYPTKWRQAKNMAIQKDKKDYSEDSAFALACRLFLELGGQRKEWINKRFGVAGKCRRIN